MVSLRQVAKGLVDPVFKQLCQVIVQPVRDQRHCCCLVTAGCFQMFLKDIFCPEPVKRQITAVRSVAAVPVNFGMKGVGVDSVVGLHQVFKEILTFVDVFLNPQAGVTDNGEF